MDAIRESVGYGLKGRLALVTGAGSGIGKVVAQTLAQEGGTVAGVDINGQAVAETIKGLPGDNHRSYTTDVSDSTGVSKLFSKVKDNYNDQVPSIVICCAGILIVKTLEDTKEEDIDKLLAVNVKGTFQVMQAGGRHMKDAGITNGSIVTFSSSSAKISRAGVAVYAASKSAVATLTMAAAKEWAHIPIRCNVVVPGPTLTPILEAMPRDYKEAVVKGIPLGRMGSPQEVADMCVFLASEKSSYITGSCLDVTGGL